MHRGACTYNPKYTINIGDKLKLIKIIIAHRTTATASIPRSLFQYALRKKSGLQDSHLKTINKFTDIFIVSPSMLHYFLVYILV